MKQLSLLLAIITSIGLKAQSPIGAWERNFTNEEGILVKSIVIFTEGYQSIAYYNRVTGAFISSNGGLWRKEGNTMIETVEFDTKTPDRVGTEVTFDIELTDNTLSIVGRDMTVTRLDDGSPGALNGAWLMSGRVRDGETLTRDASRPRKTMKILSGTCFQWIAYNTETKAFIATGGGTYSTVDGKYTENIEFFSRDNSRVGARLEFDYELINGNWHHKGLSSKGDPIHEIWKLRLP